MGIQQSKSFDGSAGSGGGHDGGRGVHYSFSIDAPEVVLALWENLSSGMVDAGRSGPNLSVHHQQVMRHLHRESQLQLHRLQQLRPLPLDSLCNPNH